MSANPTDRRYSKTHEWFQVEGNVVTIGITQFAADELTDITYVELPRVGTPLEAGKVIGEIESVKATSELFSSMNGEVVQVNTTLVDDPGLVNSDPFGKGWMVKVRVSDLTLLDQLMDAKAYEASLNP